jgi:hypothetical protein
MIQPERWDTERLEQDRQVSITRFREERLREPVELYTSLVDDRLGVVKELLKITVDLRQMNEKAVLSILTDLRYRDAFRYLAGPPISDDDWQTLATVESLAPSRLGQDPALARRLADVVLAAVDSRRFPWLLEEREPTEAERDAALLASACLWAYQKTQTERRSSGKRRLEGATEECLAANGFVQDERRRIQVPRDAPDAGHYCGETEVAGRRADFVVGLWDGRMALVECKDSNSLVNSIKRLNNDTAAKASFWITQFGEASVVPLAVISGVYYLESLTRAQNVGLRIVWEHGMDELGKWLSAVKNGPGA